jgi:4-hydroxybenzoate polyprenyltransferase
MRIIAGGVVSGIELSVWLFAFSIFFFLSLAAVKRQAELVDMAERGALTAKGRGYHIEDLPIISMVGLAAGYASVVGSANHHL